MSDLRKYLNIGLLVAVAFLAGSVITGGKGCDWKPTPVVPPVVVPVVKVTAVTYVYEKDQNAVPVQVMAALNQINREQAIKATVFEQNTTDGTNDTPEQYKVALAAAKAAGLPALVVQAGDKVIRTVKAPTTIEQVTEAVKP